MVGRTQVDSFSEGDNGSTVTEPTISELITSLKSAFQKAAFARVEAVLLYREEKLKKEIQMKNEENILLQEKLHMEVLEKLKLQTECAELKELAFRLKEEQAGLLKRLAENADENQEIAELKKKNCELKCAKLNAETEVDVCKDKLKVLEEKVSSFEKDLEMMDKIEKNGEAVTEIEKDASRNVPPDSNAGKKKVSPDAKSRSETNSKPSGSSSHSKRPDNRRPLSKEIVEIIDSDDEGALHEDSREIVNEGHVDKADTGKNIAENDPAAHKRALASSLNVNDICSIDNGKRVKIQEHDVNDICSIDNGKRVKIQEHAPFASPIEHRSPAALNLGTINSKELYTSSKLILSELSDDSSSSSGSDDNDDLNLSLDYASFMRTDDAAYKTRD